MKNGMMVLAGTFILLWASLNAYSQNSVLSEGTWFKLLVNETGIHKITYDNIVNWGINPVLINPQNIRIYGNGNGMLPESNDEFRYNDLQENSIFISGEEDGNFDQEDYILFYGEGSTEWGFNEETALFEHTVNLYSDVTCYFLNYDLGEGKRITTQSSTILPPNNFVKINNDYYYHELEQENIIHSGKLWLGEYFYDVLNYNFQVEFPNLSFEDAHLITAQAAGRSGIVSSMEFHINMTENFQIDFPAVNMSNYNSDYAKIRTDTLIFTTNNEVWNIDIVYQQPDEYSKAWLDYFEINASRNLVFDQGQMGFRNIESAGMGKVSEFSIATSSSNCSVWNVTDPINVISIGYNYSTNAVEFIFETDSLLEFIVFDDAQYFTPEYISEIENQNLHADQAVDMIIVTHENFTNQAQQLADFRESYDGISTLVVTPEKIYNEFSSGVQDITAIRDFVKYMYVKSNGEKPKYLLLFGDASYDYKNITDNNTNYVPVWESLESMNGVNSYSSDDYFSEFDELDKTSLLRIGIGRLPVKTTSEANAVVEKIIHYSSSEQAYGNWRNKVLTIADDEDGGLHLAQADEIAGLIDTLWPSSNITKVYLDAFVQDTFPGGGQSYPAVNQAITDKINEGVNIINYTGHGFYAGLAHERILTLDDLENWDNPDFYPFMFTASCDFGWYDDPDKYSLTEQAILLEGKGMSAIIAATRPTYAGANKLFHENFSKVLFSNPEYPLGHTLKHAKQLSNFSANLRKFCMFGDPAMRLAIPLNNIVTEAINGVYVDDFNDTIHPSEQLVISGFVSDPESNPMYNFNGILKVKVFDIIRTDSTLANDYSSTIVGFDVQDSVVYQFETEIMNGQFAFSFNYPNVTYEEFGKIKLSYYAHDNLMDASGCFSEIMVGGQASATPEYQKELNSIYFYPTMVSNKLNFSLTGDIDDLEISLYNLQGSLVKQLSKTNYRKGYLGTIPTSELQNGMYILKAISKSGTRSCKIIKN